MVGRLAIETSDATGLEVGRSNCRSSGLLKINKRAIRILFSLVYCLFLLVN
ncbi:hypothetical protein CKA32_001725 [Geitlerinema sp. FC II]|nr:hypothetical protein CKA32_001725 [Geitlerinema sp. FC II]